MERNITCSICGQPFRVAGYGSYVRCPYCGANLQIGNGDGSSCSISSCSTTEHNSASDILLKRLP